MPRNTGHVSQLEALTVEERRKHPVGGQDHWYLLTSSLYKGLSVLDVGAGDGRGLAILQSGGAIRTVGIDPLPVDRNYVIDLPLGDIRDKSFDAVVSMDVLEHVEDDVGFLQDLYRVARQFLFVSTPNWNEWKCQNAFHVREYTPEEMDALLAPYEFLSWTCGVDREKEPPFRIGERRLAMSSFGILIRGSECTDEQWVILRELPRVPPTLPKDLARLSRTAEEWITYFKARVADLAPLRAAEVLVREAVECLLLSDGEMPIPPNDAVKTLRFGRAGPRQQAVLLAWLFNTFVLGPDGPYVNQAKG